MNVNVHIENLILEGIPFDPADSPRLRAAVEAEIARRISLEGVAPRLLDSNAVPSISGPAVELRNDGEPVALGRQIGEAVHGGISR